MAHFSSTASPLGAIYGGSGVDVMAVYTVLQPGCRQERDTVQFIVYLLVYMRTPLLMGEIKLLKLLLLKHI